MQNINYNRLLVICYNSIYDYVKQHYSIVYMYMCVCILTYITMPF